MKKVLLLAVFISLLNCSETKKNAFTISGVNTELAGDTIYLKKFEHFNYLDKNYILDTCIVDDNGAFSFNIKSNYPKLVSLTNHNKAPNTYQVFKDSPEIFYYSFCANFLAETPTLYLENNSSYTIKHWDSKLKDTSVVFDSKKLNQLRKYYRTVSFRKSLSDEERAFLDIAKEQAWNSVKKMRDSLLTEFTLNKNVKDNSFENYFATEIELGAINDFLIWYFRKTDNSIDNKFYEDLMETYNAKNWHPNSVEYYKLTEHYVNYKMNLKKQQKVKYYEPSYEKYEVAKKYARKNIRDIYANNIRALIKDNDAVNKSSSK